MELRELRSFCAAAEARSITKAAERLGLGQPTVTLHIKALEQEIGNTLFDRGKRPLRLTVLGSRLFKFASPMLGQIDALRNELVGSDAPRTIVFAVTTELVEHVAAEGIAGYRNNHPSIDLRVRSGRVAEVQQMVRTKEVSLGLMPDIEGEPTIIPHAVFICERVLLAPKGHPIAKADVTYAEIARWPLIVSSRRNDAPSYIEEQLERHNLPYHTVMELDSSNAVKRYVAEGLGISILPTVCVSPYDEDRLAVVRIPELLPRYRIGMMGSSGAYLADYVFDFLDAMISSLRPRFDSTIFPHPQGFDTT